jgi:putative Holliday junction resolvase
VRALGLDLGARRIGVALSDSRGTLASPRGAILRSKDPARDRAAVAAMVAETCAEVVVVGLPLSLDGSAGPAARWAFAEVEALAAVLAVPVQTIDERLSTVSASRAMTAAGRPVRRQRGRIDSAAAAILLQSWLDGHCASGRTA